MQVDVGTWVSVSSSGVATVVSIAALWVSIVANRAAGPRVSVSSSYLTAIDSDWWLRIKVTNSGRSEIDIDGAWAGWLGQTLTELPARLLGGSSKILTFRGKLPPTQFLGSTLTVQIALGNGDTILRRVTLNENDVFTESAKQAAGLPDDQLKVRIEEI
jgi:hypothetical protein